MFPCSQQNFPCVPVFPKSISSVSVFPIPLNMLFSRVPSYIFLLFPYSHVPWFPEPPGGSLKEERGVRSAKNRVKQCQVYFSLTKS